jgi:hypothetical protein
MDGLRVAWDALSELESGRSPGGVSLPRTAEAAATSGSPRVG